MISVQCPNHQAHSPTRQRLAHTAYFLPVYMACLPMQQQAPLPKLPLLTKEAPSCSATKRLGQVDAGQLAVLHSASAWWACWRLIEQAHVAFQAGQCSRG